MHDLGVTARASLGKDHIHVVFFFCRTFGVDEHNVRGEAPVGQVGLGHVSKQCGLPTDSEGEQP